MIIGEIDQYYNNKGFTVIGIDEAGRGPLCGPVTVSAVSLIAHIDGLNDSKKLSEKKRNTLVPEIIENSIWAVYSVLPNKIDDLNILHATLWGMKLVAKRVFNRTHHEKMILIDGNKTLQSFPFEKALVKGDSKSFNIAAASILAKYHRDKIMGRWDKIYPQFNLSSHKGYPTREHYELLEEFGPTPIHRKSFKLKKIKQPKQMGLF